MPAHREGGARARFQFGAAKKSARPREEGSAGGGWGEECRAVRANTKEASPTALLGQSRAKQNILFLLEEDIRRAQKKSRENFFAGWRALASGGGAASFVGGFPKMRSDFVQGMEPTILGLNEIILL